MILRKLFWATFRSFGAKTSLNPLSTSEKNMLKRLSVFCLGITLLFTAHLSQVQAQISGFNFLQGYTFNQGDNDPAPTVGQDFIDITNDGGNFRSVFFNTRQSIDTFTASFSYEASAGPVGSSPGISFIVQNDPRGTGAITNVLAGSGFGGIDQSIGVVFDIEANDVDETTVSVLQNGAISGDSGASLGSLDPRLNTVDITINYDGGTLLNVIADDGVNTPFNQTVLLPTDITTAIGSDDAFIGFGGSTLLFDDVTQTISNFQFSSTSTAVPEPSSAFVLAGIGSVLGLTRRRRITTI